MQYIRASDGFPVSRDEACTPAGVVKAGYKLRVATIADGQRVGFEHLFMDSGQSDRRVFLTDTSVTLTDAEASLAVAHARRAHDAAHGWRGARAPAFTDAQAALAQAAAAARKKAPPTTAATQVQDAVTTTTRAMLAESNRQRKAAIANAWRK